MATTVSYQACAACLGEAVVPLSRLEALAFRDPTLGLGEIGHLKSTSEFQGWSVEQRASLDAIAGEAYRQTGHAEAALTAANEGLLLLPPPHTVPIAIRLRALHALEIDETAGTTLDAVAELTQALTEVPNDARADACLRKDRGFLRNTLGDTEGALTDLTTAYQYLTEHGPVAEAMVAAGRLAPVYRHAHAYSEAASLVTHTIAYFENIQAWVRTATARERLGQILVDQHQYAAAMRQFTEMRRLSLLGGDAGGVGYADLNACQVHIELREFSVALPECQRSETELRSLGPLETFDQATLATRFGRIALGAGDPRQAITYLTTAIQTHAPELNGEFGAEVYRSRSEAYATSGEYRNAYADGLEYTRRLQTLNDLNTARQITLQRVRADMDREKSNTDALRREHVALIARTEQERRERRFVLVLSMFTCIALVAFVLIAHRRQLAEAKRQAAEYRLEELGRLTAGIAHDFNNLMTVVQQATGMLARRQNLAADAESASLLQAVRDAATTGGGITAQLLAFGRQQNLRPETIVVDEYFARQSALFKQTLGDRIALETTIEDPALLLRADRAQLTSALINLLINARDAIAGRGTVRIVVETGEKELGTRDLIRLTVTDTGPGMDSAVLERASEPFFTTKQPGQGSGLGLSAVHGFVRQSGGRLSIQSTQGLGTMVSLWLPRAASS